MLYISVECVSVWWIGTVIEKVGHLQISYAISYIDVVADWLTSCKRLLSFVYARVAYGENEWIVNN